MTNTTDDWDWAAERTGATPWQLLAQEARRLAELAERCAATEPEVLAPIDGRDPLAELDQQAASMRGLASLCRRDTYRRLRAGGASVADLARAWHVTTMAIYKVLGPSKPAK